MTEDEPAYATLLEHLLAAADALELATNPGVDPDDAAPLFTATGHIKALLRRLRGLDRLILVPVDDGVHEDNDGCRWEPWLAVEPAERRVCDGCAVPCNEGWITDEDFNDATGAPLVRCTDCLRFEDAPAG